MGPVVRQSFKATTCELSVSLRLLSGSSRSSPEVCPSFKVMDQVALAVELEEQG